MEIKKTKTTFIISVLKVVNQVVLVFSISNFFTNKNYQGRKLSGKKIPSSGISALASKVAYLRQFGFFLCSPDCPKRTKNENSYWKFVSRHICSPICATTCVIHSNFRFLKDMEFSLCKKFVQLTNRTIAAFGDLSLDTNLNFKFRQLKIRKNKGIIAIQINF